MWNAISIESVDQPGNYFVADKLVSAIGGNHHQDFSSGDSHVFNSVLDPANAWRGNPFWKLASKYWLHCSTEAFYDLLFWIDWIVHGVPAYVGGVSRAKSSTSKSSA